MRINPTDYVGVGDPAQDDVEGRGSGPEIERDVRVDVIFGGGSG